MVYLPAGSHPSKYLPGPAYRLTSLLGHNALPLRHATNRLLKWISKYARSTSLYHFRQCGIVLKPLSDRIDYTVVCFLTHDCSQKLRKRHQCELYEYRGLTEFTSYGSMKACSGWLGRWYVCWLYRGSNCLLVQATDGRIVRCGFISSCQSAATFRKIHKNGHCT